MGGADKRCGLGEVLHAASRIVCIHCDCEAMSTENEGRQIIQTCFFETHIPLRNGDYSEGIFHSPMLKEVVAMRH
eukprot:scaffold1637_cov195-Alexandrium_tamarense.AAC.12